MTTATKTHKYKGETIEPCECEKYHAGYRWRIRAYHSPTGIPWSESECWHSTTLAAMREYIDEFSAD